jgi:hypothetical protein
METLSLRQRFLQDMQLKGFADDTQENYLGHIIRYVKYYMKNPEELNEQHIKEYLHSLVKEGKSTSSINQSYSALRFLYETTLKTDYSFSLFLLYLRLNTYPIQWTHNVTNAFLCHVCIYLRSFRTRVPQQLLYVSQIYTSF